MTRRNFLTQLLAVPTLSLLGSGITPVTTMAGSSPKRSRALWLRQVHTEEELQVSYWKDGTLNNQAYAQLCHLLRDFRVNQSTNIDVALLDLLYTIQTLLSKERIYKPFMVLSAYRTKTTNDRLKGTARNSMHLSGKAIDIFIPGVRTEYLASLGHRLRCGGVGTTYTGASYTLIPDGYAIGVLAPLPSCRAIPLLSILRRSIPSLTSIHAMKSGRMRVEINWML